MRPISPARLTYPTGRDKRPLGARKPNEPGNSPQTAKSKQAKHKINYAFFKLFCDYDVTMVTTLQGHREWHITRKFGLSSNQAHALVKALLHHDLDCDLNTLSSVARARFIPHGVKQSREFKSHRVDPGSGCVSNLATQNGGLLYGSRGREG